VIALVAVAVAVALRWLLDPIMGDTLPLVTVFGAVAAAVWVGVYRPALLVMAVGYLTCAYLFIEPRGAFGLGESRNLVGLAPYLITCAIIIAFGEAMRVARRRAEVRRELLRITISSVGDAIITTDAQGRVASLNPIAENLTSWKHQDAQGVPLENVFKIINEETRQPVENPVKKVLAENKVVGLANHTVLIAKDGSERSIDDSAAPIRDADGNILGVVLIFRDITERRNAERVIADARAYAESIVDTVREPLLVLDSQLRVVTASRSFCHTFHVTAEETHGQLLYHLGNRQWDIPALRNLLEEVLPQNVQFDNYEVEHEFPAIGRRVMLLNARRIYRDGNHTELILLAIEDVTERKGVHDAERRLAALVESSDDAIISKSLDGIILSWNAAAERLFGYTPQQAVGRHISFLFPPDRLDEEDRIIARLRAGERVEHFDTVRVRSDGQPVDVSLTISPIKDETGRVTAASKIARDVTERKRMEQQLREYAADLSDADRRKNEFLAMLAHELRNPLATIRNAVQVMRLTGGDGDAVASLSEMMDRQVGQLVRLVDDLLDLSRISRGKIDLRRSRLELGTVVKQAVEAARSLAQCLDHELTVSLPPKPIYVNADATRVAQVFGNLLSNACKFTEKAGRIEVTVEQEDKLAAIRVRDTGIGIDAEQLPRIFDMFMQVDTSLERSTSGLGIGLTLVKNLVEMHDGTIQVHSAGVGEGSEFVVRLPVMDESTQQPQLPAESGLAPTKSRRILIVDDNRDSAKSLAMLLKLTGNETHTARDGLEAVEAAERIRPDVVLLDIGLPKLNGYEACRRIRQQPWGKNMVLVALTGWGQDDDRKKSSDAGFDGHLVKPVELVVLNKLLDET
jgi:PAS domain S-box-containing protein